MAASRIAGGHRGCLNRPSRRERERQTSKTQQATENHPGTRERGPSQHRKRSTPHDQSQAQASAADAVCRHQPVLLERCLDLLAPAIEGHADSTSTGGPARPVMIDCTLGMGGPHRGGA